MLVELLEIALKYISFEFKSQHYLQVKGKAMDNKIANIVILEDYILASVSLPRIIWLGFADDVTMTSAHSQEKSSRISK